MVNNGNFKKKNKRPNKQDSKRKVEEVSRTKYTIRGLKPSRGIANEDTCFYCCKFEHLKRNFPKYLEDKKNEVESSTSGIFVIEINYLLIQDGYWILDMILTFVLMFMG